jgi:hypothetical protein
MCTIVRWVALQSFLAARSQFVYLYFIFLWLRRICEPLADRPDLPDGGGEGELRHVLR